MILGGCIAESRTPHEDLSIPFCLREHCVQWACSKKFWRLGQLCQTDAYTIKHIYLSVKAFHQSVRPNARSWKVMGYRVHQSGYRRSCEAVSFCPASYKRGPSTLHSSLLKLKTPLTHIEVYIYVCIPISNSGMHTSYESPSDFRVRDCQRLACMHSKCFWRKRCSWHVSTCFACHKLIIECFNKQAVSLPPSMSVDAAEFCALLLPKSHVLAALEAQAGWVRRFARGIWSAAQSLLWLECTAFGWMRMKLNKWPCQVCTMSHVPV